MMRLSKTGYTICLIFSLTEAAVLSISQAKIVQAEPERQYMQLARLECLAGVSTPACGNGIKETGEQCDFPDLAGRTCLNYGSTVAAGLSCYPPGHASQCTFDTSGCILSVCGNGIVEPPLEECDGANLNGQDCSDFGYANPDGLACSACIFDESGCGDYECTGSVALYAMLCAGDDSNLSGTLPIIHVQECTDTRKCEASCDTGYIVTEGADMCIESCTQFTTQTDCEDTCCTKNDCVENKYFVPPEFNIPPCYHYPACIWLFQSAYCSGNPTADCGHFTNIAICNAMSAYGCSWHSFTSTCQGTYDCGALPNSDPGCTVVSGVDTGCLLFLAQHGCRGGIGQYHYSIEMAGPVTAWRDYPFDNHTKVWWNGDIIYDGTRITGDEYNYYMVISHPECIAQEMGTYCNWQPWNWNAGGTDANGQYNQYGVRFTRL